jgi:hypothetical protein
MCASNGRCFVGVWLSVGSVPRRQTRENLLAARQVTLSEPIELEQKPSMAWWRRGDLRETSSDLRAALGLVSGQSGASADLIVMGRSAADAFESNAQVQTAYDKLRISPGQLSFENISWGVALQPKKPPTL